MSSWRCIIREGRNRGVSERRNFAGTVKRKGARELNKLFGGTWILSSGFTLDRLQGNEWSGRFKNFRG